MAVTKGDFLNTDTKNTKDTDLKNVCMNVYHFIRIYAKSLVIFIAPIVLLPVILTNDTPANRCLYVLLLEATFWSTEALPLPITSLLPIFLFPVLGILSTTETCNEYMSDVNMNLICGIMLALAVQDSNLHNRIGLKVISIIGCSQRKMTFGLTMMGMLVSMWISNSAAMSMMVPIIKAVLEGLEDEGLFELYIDDEKDGKSERRMFNLEKHPKKPAKITICYFMGAAYATSIGGCGSVLATGTNLAFKLIYEKRFPRQKLGFLKWIYFNVPLMLINTIAMWIYLQCYFMGMFRPKSEEAKLYTLDEDGEQVAREVISNRYDELGPISQREIQVATLFLLSVTSYIVRATLVSSENEMIGDATLSVFIVTALFVLPSCWDWIQFFKCNSDEVPEEKSTGLITWKFITKHIPWGMIFLLGGGFALVRGGERSGMSSMLGEYLARLRKLPLPLLIFLICFIIQIVTEFVASTAIVNVILPVLAEVAVNIKVHPLYLMYPATLSCAMGFHTIFGTAHNLYAADAANISTRDIVIVGFGPSLITLFTICTAFPTWGRIIYPEISSFPDWAENSTAIQGSGFFPQ